MNFKHKKHEENYTKAHHNQVIKNQPAKYIYIYILTYRGTNNSRLLLKLYKLEDSGRTYLKY